MTLVDPVSSVGLMSLVCLGESLVNPMRLVSPSVCRLYIFASFSVCVTGMVVDFELYSN